MSKIFHRIIVLVAAAIAGCNSKSKTLESVVSTVESQTDKSATAFLARPGGFYAFCSYREGELQKEISLPVDQQFCSSELLSGACDQQSSTVQETASSLLESKDLSHLKSLIENVSDVQSELENMIVAHAKTCLDRGELLANLAAKAIAEQPKNLERLEAGRKRFWRYVFRITVELGSRGSVAMYQSDFYKRMRKLIVHSVCSGASEVGAKLLANNQGSTQEIACMKTASSICRAVGGFVNLQSIVSDQEAEGVVSDIISIANAGLGAACDSIGATLACGLISESFAQIRQAIQSGDNDWAQCSGATDLGRKLGEIWISRQSGVTSNQLEAPIAKAFDFNGKSHTLCCRCNRSYYQDHLLTSDEKFRIDSVLQYALEPDLNGSNSSFCESYEHRNKVYLERPYYGYATYYQYERCEEVLLDGVNDCEYTNDAYSKGERLPLRNLSGQPTSGRTTHFGPPQVFIGTIKCLDDKCL